MRLLAALLAALVLVMPGSVSSTASNAPPLSVAAAIETTRPMVDEQLRVAVVSPNGRLYVIMLIRGDVARDGVWAEIFVGDRTTLNGATPRLLTRLFTRGLGSSIGMGTVGSSPLLTAPWSNVPLWLNDNAIALKWEDSRRTPQIVTIDVKTGAVEDVTKSEDGVYAFVHSDAGIAIYDSTVRYSRDRSNKLLNEGFVVRSSDALPLLAGYVDGADASDFGNCDRYLIRMSHAGSVRIDLDASVFCQTSFVGTPPSSNVSLFSPDDRWAIVNVTADHIRPEWRIYEQADFKTLLTLRDANPKDLYAKLIQELRVVDTKFATSRPLWTVPVNRRSPPRFKWAADSQSVLLWPTFLPVGLSPELHGLEGEALAQVDVVTGSVKPFELTGRKASTVSDARWLSADACALEFSDGTVSTFVKQGERWTKKEGGDAADSRAPATRVHRRYVDIELRQDINTPPRLFARDPATRHERQVLDLNPGLQSRFSMSRVKFVEWKDDTGRKWRGRLYYPLNHDPIARYPLVIQTHGYAGEHEFSIYGQGDGAPNLGPGWSVYLAQPLAGRGIAVLQVGGPEQPYDSLNEMVRSSGAESGLRTAVEYLSREGLVDADRVGLMAHSSTGRIAEHALTYSPFRFAAAIAADYADGNYLQAALYGWPQFSAELNGDAPFGLGLKSWLTNSPAFNAERIRTPLQLQVTSATDGLSALLWHWELFSRLRYLKKPVEYYVVPDITHGSHTLQNPRQLLAIQQRALDWWCFWLKGEESDDPNKWEQYASWREMRNLQ